MPTKFTLQQLNLFVPYQTTLLSRLLFTLLLWPVSSLVLLAQEPVKASDRIVSFNSDLAATNAVQPPLGNFKIAIAKRPGGILLKGLEGTAWLELSFTLRPNEQQVVDALGMTNREENLKEKREEKELDLAGFLFTVVYKKRTIRLLGQRGTAWKELVFSLGNGEEQLIDQFGMVE